MQNNWEDVSWLSTVVEQIYWVQCTMKAPVFYRDKHGFIMNYCHLTQNHGDDFLTSLWQMVYKFISLSCEKQRYIISKELHCSLTWTKLCRGKIYLGTRWPWVEDWGILTHALKLQYLKLFFIIVKVSRTYGIIGFITEKIYWIIYSENFKKIVIASLSSVRSCNQFTSESISTFGLVWVICEI